MSTLQPAVHFSTEFACLQPPTWIPLSCRLCQMNQVRVEEERRIATEARNAAKETARAAAELAVLARFEAKQKLSTRIEERLHEARLRRWVAEGISGYVLYSIALRMCQYDIPCTHV